MFKFEFIKGFFREETGKPSQKRLIIFSAIMLLNAIVFANLVFDKVVDYAVLGVITLILLAGLNLLKGEISVDSVAEIMSFGKEKLNKKNTDENEEQLVNLKTKQING